MTFSPVLSPDHLVATLPDREQAPLSLAARPSPAEGQTARRMPRLPMLDGWRGVSILLVLMAHMLPLGPKDWQLNDAAGRLGMSIFFTLSGFLIVSTLFFHPSVKTFVLRRLTRIVPAAWLFIIVVLAATRADATQWWADLLFCTNLPPYHLTPVTGHLWSLCVEVQFYAAIAFVFLLLGRRGLGLLPLACVLVTLNRMRTGHEVSIVTLYRVDEILAGGSLAWFFQGPGAVRLRALFSKLPVAIPMLLLVLACVPQLHLFNYLRPYFAAATVAATLFQADSRWNRLLVTRPLRYLAEISYALYVWHPLATHGWFDAGSATVKYLKRPVGLALSFGIAHLSTDHYEAWWIQVGKRWSTRTAPSRTPAQPQFAA